MPQYEAAIGRYLPLSVSGTDYRVYVEEAGTGIPVLCQHTAGADGRQWRHLLADEELTQRFRFIAYDLPFHGRSLPPEGEPWWTRRYSLTQAFLLDFVTSIVEALELEQGVYMGCSMGGHLAPDLALNRPGLFRAAIAIQGGLATKGGGAPYADYLSHPRTSNETKGALMMGQMAPTSPEAFRREVTWVYMQGAPEVMRGDLDYYWNEHDLTETAGEIDTSLTELHVVTGEYDYSATSDKGRELADAVEGATFTPLRDVGHFPMSENPAVFLEAIGPILDGIASRVTAGGGDEMRGGRRTDGATDHQNAGAKDR